MEKPKSLSTWQLIRKSLQQSQPVMLLYVVESHGSSPGRQGFLMAVNALGEMEGSIGGGIMEHKFVEMAKEKLQHYVPELSIRTQYHDKKAAHNQSGMICSGDQTILLYRVEPGDTPAVEYIIDSLEQHKNGVLQLSPAGIQCFDNPSSKMDRQFVRQSGQEWTYQERLGYKNQLFIIGGGHCALALSRLMSQMDFYIRVYDNRPELHTMQLNDVAHEKILVDSYSELTDLIPSGNHHYVVVMTFGYRTDDLAIRALLDKQLMYVGVLGSQTKIKKLFSDYRAEGISDDKLKRIHAPIGLTINSQTPEEIAVSIAAQIIRVKNAGQ
ncbi:XdhC family protein [Spirosoma validum]|uniref:XdhC family protein n=1 Tax=Spirosoma validum TaxID=2771355 RepID=A0A927GE66_9BACT|nr:XdhC/CoxI family protein [Spirosoma validum]MBD2754449.1 XdhC family protein [Spirosoma validum]